MPGRGGQNSYSQCKHGHNVLKHMVILKNMTKCWKQRAPEERLSHLTWVGDIFSLLLVPVKFVKLDVMFKKSELHDKQQFFLLFKIYMTPLQQ